MKIAEITVPIAKAVIKTSINKTEKPAFLRKLLIVAMIEPLHTPYMREGATKKKGNSRAS